MRMVIFHFAITVIIIIDYCCFKTSNNHSSSDDDDDDDEEEEEEDDEDEVVQAAAVVTMLRSFMTIGSTGRMTKTHRNPPSVPGPARPIQPARGCVGAKLLPQKC